MRCYTELRRGTLASAMDLISLTKEFDSCVLAGMCPCGEHVGEGWKNTWYEVCALGQVYIVTKCRYSIYLHKSFTQMNSIWGHSLNTLIEPSDRRSWLELECHASPGGSSFKVGSMPKFLVNRLTKTEQSHAALLWPVESPKFPAIPRTLHVPN